MFTESLFYLRLLTETFRERAKRDDLFCCSGDSDLFGLRVVYDINPFYSCVMKAFFVAG